MFNKFFSYQGNLELSRVCKRIQGNLGADLQTLGKALARWGTYKQIADAAFCCSSLKTFLIKKTLQAVGKERNDLCSKKRPSLLRKSGPDEMENFSFQKLCEEWKQRAPLFYSFLTACATGKENACDWTPAMAVAGSTLLKNWNMHMQQHHLSLSWSGKVQRRFVDEVNITLVSFLHPILDNKRLPWIVEIKNNLSNSQNSLSGCIPVAMPCSDLENSHSCLNSTISN